LYNYDKAIELWLEALKVQKLVLGERSLKYAESLRRLAEVYQEQKDFENASLFCE
jgi:hypothetical protein